MAIIHLTTKINAPVKRCFDLSRNIDMHVSSMKGSGEQAVDGTTKGLIGLGESVTWKARHFGLIMTMTVKIMELKYPEYFVDEMIKGPFKKLHHTHSFEEQDGYTLMKDRFEFESPIGFLGKLADWLFMKRYMVKLLETRNKSLRETAEK
jgi:ligand-binding SRPBCC domain-containing protein